MRRLMKHTSIRTFGWLAAGLLGACQAARSGEAPAPTFAKDEHTQAEPERVRVTHASLELALDFEAQRAEGSVLLELEREDSGAPLVLDTCALEILSVAAEDGSARRFELGPEHAVLGRALRIALEPADRAVRVHYRTSPAGEAMQWLAPEQTADGRHPFLFTQGQSILTRSWIPLQDSPGVRITYDAAIRAPEGLTPVMSAEQLGRSADGAWRFRMRQPIPAYLIALACGALEFRAISPRSGVWAEPSVVARARDELIDTEAMIQSAEALFGPYRWGRYDLIILPPAFPFGGMENPRLTFATPTILAGDKSLVGLVAHELAHSWSGNLVTNATWRDFWLNEGFTVYCEQRIMERVYGLGRSQMEQVLARRELELELAELEPWQQVLHVEFDGRHPDEAFSHVPYEKGALFLRHLERHFGRPAFDAFLRKWFDEHAFQSVTTADFLAYLERELASAPGAAAELELAEWMEGISLPASAPRAQSALLGDVDREVERWQSGVPAAQLTTAGWVTQQWLRFQDALPAELEPEAMAELDRSFGFTQSDNSEILCAWLVKCVHNGYAPADARLEEFLMNIGRRKFLKPLYAELAKTEAGLARAREIYARARPRYHAVSQGTLDGLLGV